MSWKPIDDEIKNSGRRVPIWPVNRRGGKQVTGFGYFHRPHSNTTEGYWVTGMSSTRAPILYYDLPDPPSPPFQHMGENI